MEIDGYDRLRQRRKIWEMSWRERRKYSRRVKAIMGRVIWVPRTDEEITERFVMNLAVTVVPVLGFILLVLAWFNNGCG